MFPRDNCHVERYHRAYGEECLRVFRPGTEEEVREVTDAEHGLVLTAGEPPLLIPFVEEA